MNVKLLPENGLILCAVSGGIDSMYLLSRLLELGYPVAAAHYNHGLRGAASDRDECFVRDFCAKRGIPFLSERGDAAAYARDHRAGLEAACRALRYDFLDRAADRLGASVIATAHTADDNAETILLHLARGTGLRGLCGVPPARGRVVRPMLELTRAEAAAYLEERGIPHVEDATNASDDYARNRVRHAVIPALRAENPALLRGISRMAASLREDEAYLSGLAEDFVREHADGGALPVGALLALPAPVRARAVRLMAGGRELSASQTEAILSVAARGGVTDASGLRVGRSGDRLIFGAEPSAALPERSLEWDVWLALPEAGLRVRARRLERCPTAFLEQKNIFYFKYGSICGNITITAGRPGDRLRPAGRGCTKALRRLLREAGVPAWRRQSVPVLRDGAGVLGVYGAGPAERACARPGDEDVLEIEFSPAHPAGGTDFGREDRAVY